MMRFVFTFVLASMTMKLLAQHGGELAKKLPPELYEKLQAASQNDRLEVSVSLKTNDHRLSKAFQLKEKYSPAGIYTAILSKKEIFLLIAQPEVAFISEQQKAKEELNTGAVDYTLNRIRKAQHFFPGIKGDSILISVKERSFDTTDI